MASEIETLRLAIEQLSRDIRGQPSAAAGVGNAAITPAPQSPPVIRAPQSPIRRVRKSPAPPDVPGVPAVPPVPPPVPAVPPVPPPVPAVPPVPPPVPPSVPASVPAARTVKDRRTAQQRMDQMYPTDKNGVIDTTVAKRSEAAQHDRRPQKQLNTATTAAASSLTKFAAGLVSVGTVMKGLQGTVEGYQLNYAFSHLAFEIADMFRGPIRIITREIEGLARVLRVVENDAGATGGTAGVRGVDGIMRPGAPAGGKSAPMGFVASTIAGTVLAGPLGGIATGLGSILSSKIDAMTAGMNQEEANRLSQQKNYSGSFAIAEKGIREKNPAYEALGMKQLREGFDEAVAEKKRIEALPYRQRFRDKAPEWEEADRKQDLHYGGIIQLQKLKASLANEPAQKVATNPSFGSVKPVGTGGKPDDHLQPILQTSTGQVQDLQMKLQALSTENPAQEQGLSLVESCYNMLVKIYNKLPGGDKMQEIPNPVKANM